MRRDRAREQRLNATQGLSDFLAPERSRLFDDASPERQAKMVAAERTREVYGAWNAVCAATREGRHVTGLHYLPESNELVVYTDGAAWTQELTMLREIIRARMAARGVDLAGFIFRTSRDGYRTPAQKAAPRAKVPGAAHAEKKPVPRAPLSAEEDAALSREVSGIEDDGLREALKKAMKANLEWKKGLQG